jgi:succinoglycan biosynthesis transport protein ExoP
MTSHDLRSDPDLRAYLAIVWRHRFVILPFVVLLPLFAYLRTDPRPTAYEASATVLLNRQSQALSGLSDPLLWSPDRVIRTQSQLARIPEIANRVVRASGLGDRDAGMFLANSSISANEDNDLMTFRVRDADPQIAVRLANLYAQKYIEYRRDIDTRALREAANTLDKQIEQLRRQGLSSSGGYAALIEKREQLRTAETVQGSSVLLVREASGAAPIIPQRMRTTILAFGLGLILGLGLAFLVDTLDTRVRSVDDLAGAIELPLLSTIPSVRRRFGRRGRLIMLDAPNSAAAEPFRILRTNVDFALDLAMSREYRSILVTSALDREGKSTTSANLAVAMARAGRHVILAGLDLRRPTLEGFSGLTAGPGVTDVALGRVRLEDALRKVPLGLQALRERSTGTDVPQLPPLNGTSRVGVLEVIGAGFPPEIPGEFTGTVELDFVLERMRQQADLVIVDGPPLLLSSDALTLSSKVSALLVVARLNMFKRRHVSDLNRILASCPAAKLGLVVTGAPLRGKGYYGYRVREPQRQLIE